MKVLIVIPTLGDGGAERMVADLSATLVKKGWQIEVLSLYGEHRAKKHYVTMLRKVGITVHFLDKRRGFDWILIPKIRRKIREINPDIIHTHLSACIYVVFASCFMRVKRVHTIHSVVKKELNCCYRGLMCLQYKLRTCIPVAISQTMKNEIQEYYGLLPECVGLAANGIDISRFEGKSSEVKEYAYIFAGRLVEAKNPMMLLEAFAKAHRKIPEARLCICGEGIMRKEIEGKIERLGLTESVDVVGHVDDIGDYLARSKCFVLSSKFEGFGLVIVEAMAAGLPVIATRVGSIPEIVRDGIDGILVDANDADQMASAMIRIIKVISSDEYEKMRESVLARAKEFSVEKMVDAYEQIYLKNDAGAALVK